MQRVVITGSSGFIGSKMCSYLNQDEFEVIQYDIQTGQDIRNYQQLLDTLQKNDIILHLAALSTMKACDDNPCEAWYTNVGGTINVCKAAKEKQCNRVVFASTGTTYAPVKFVPISEDHPQIGVSEYGWTKIEAEKAVQRYAPAWIILRYAHIYGNGKRWGVVESFKSRIERGLKPTIYGGNQSKDMIYIRDVLRANMFAITKPMWNGDNEILNIGTGEELNIKQAFKIMNDVFRWNVTPDIEPSRSGDPERHVFNINKALQNIGFKSHFSFKEGLEDMVREEKNYERT